MKDMIRYINLGDGTSIKINLTNTREATEEELNDGYWQDRYDDWDE